MVLLPPSLPRTDPAREILQGQTPILTFQDGRATLRVQNGDQSVTFDLDKASVPEAKRQLQDLTFGLVEQLQALEKRLEEVTATATPVALRSPEKASARQRLLGADFSPRKPRGEASPSKRRLPGESLINPGFRSKKTPTGVDFEDA
ncbi:protein PAXX isoform X2 [Pseudonaja textilis]|uniref:protein PAXX isoform X2 n=1 Tax=Pseudonaja textilis TaxID=8673 RepID=UPI000EA9D02A|nr:protein PAXX isoform X2 [Pseudonaja textilis]